MQSCHQQSSEIPSHRPKNDQTKTIVGFVSLPFKFTCKYNDKRSCVALACVAWMKEGCLLTDVCLNKRTKNHKNRRMPYLQHPETTETKLDLILTGIGSGRGAALRRAGSARSALRRRFCRYCCCCGVACDWETVPANKGCAGDAYRRYGQPVWCFRVRHRDKQRKQAHIEDAHAVGGGGGMTAWGLCHPLTKQNHNTPRKKIQQVGE